MLLFLSVELKKLRGLGTSMPYKVTSPRKTALVILDFCG